MTDPAASDLVTDVGALPTHAVYLPFSALAGTGLPRDYERAFALLQRGKEVLLLRTPQAAHSRPEFDIGERCRGAGLTVGERIAVSEEVLKALHQRHQKQQDAVNAHPLSEVQRTAFGLIQSAAALGASDIHIVTRDAMAEVFFRIHGERVKQPALATASAMDVIRVLYNVHADAGNSGTNWDPNKVQDTAVEHRLQDGARLQLRFNSAPVYPAGSVQCTLRLLRMDGDQAARALEVVGYTPDMVREIEEMLVGSTGLVLLVGPTNSGKSTSIQSFIQRIYERRGQHIKVVTIEDPVEYIIDAACQMGVPRGKLKTDEIAQIYRELLGSTLRQDPDVALVGEIRTHEQAEPVKDMVLAGRKILSTLHAYEAMAVFPRLREIGIPESLLTRPGFVSGVIYQRLVPVLCPDCARPLDRGCVEAGRLREATYRRVMEVVDPDMHQVKVRNPQGCERCARTGIVGRTPCAELLVPDETFLRHLRAGDELAATRHWHATGLNTDGAGVRVMAHAIAKMRHGLVDPNDIEVQIGKIQIERLDRTDSAPAPAPAPAPAAAVAADAGVTARDATSTPLHRPARVPAHEQPRALHPARVAQVMPCLP